MEYNASTIAEMVKRVMADLEKNGADIPVVYFTELLAEALGVKEDTDGE